MRIKISKWSLCINISWRENAEMDHYCLNQIMDGIYDCEYCEPREVIKCMPARGIDSDDEVTSSGGEKK